MNLIRIEEEDHHVVHPERERDIDQEDHHLMEGRVHLIVGGVGLETGGDHHLIERRVMIEGEEVGVIVLEGRRRGTVVVSVVGVTVEGNCCHIFRSGVDK